MRKTCIRHVAGMCYIVQVRWESRTNRIVGMNNRHLLSIIVFPLLIAGCVSEKTGRPNIVLIMADDMGHSDIAPYGGEIRTPNLQRLADEGVRFTHFYNAARCCPTRASLLTGLYPHQAGIGHMTSDDGLRGYRGDLSRQAVTIAEVLGASGYATYMSGKWHVTNQMGFWTGDSSSTSKHNWPLQRGFDRFFGTILGAGSFYDPVTLTSGNTPIEPPTNPFYYTDAISTNAVSFIRDHAAEAVENEPFFLYVSYTAPHWPLHALEEDIARYEGEYDRGWDAIRKERRERMIQAGLVREQWPLAPRDPVVPAWTEIPENEKAWYERAMEVYAAQVDRMDQGIGSIVETLRETGQEENTLLVFLADNGGCAEVLTPEWRGLFLPDSTRDGEPVAIGNDFDRMPGPEDSYQSYGPHWAHASNTPFRRYKHWVHEGGIASPLIIHWPARMGEEGILVDDIGHLIDLMATFAEASDATYPERYNGEDIVEMEGTSLLPVIDGSKIGERNLFWEHEGNRAVRSGRWKLVSAYDGDWELYDMVADRTELNNLKNVRTELADSLATLYDVWAERAFVVPWESLQERRRSVQTTTSLH